MTFDENEITALAALARALNDLTPDAGSAVWLRSGTFDLYTWDDDGVERELRVRVRQASSGAYTFTKVEPKR